MKRLFLFVSLLVGLVLVACGGGVVEEETAVSSVETVREEPTAVVVARKPADPNRIYPMSDLSQVASTGKPQFLNSFANW